MIANQLLYAYPFLENISARSRRLIEAEGVLRVFKRGETVMRQGDRVGGMFLLVAGRVRVFMISAEGDDATSIP